MKQTNFFKKTLLLAALLAGVSTAWAIDIPQALGSYISLGTTSGATGDVVTGVNLSNCSVDNSNTRIVSETTNYYTVGNTKDNTVVTFTINVASADDYIFNFKTGAGNCSAVLALSLKNSSNTEVWSGTTNVEQTRDSWALGSGHYFKFSVSEAGTYTMSISVTSKTGSYAGNWGDFAFNSADAFDGATWPTSSSMITLSDGIYGGGCSGTDNIGSIRAGSCAEYIVKNSTANTYLLHMGITYYGEGRLHLSITDILTGTKEVDQEYDIPVISSYNDFTFPITAQLTTGVKQVRFSFSGPGNGSSYIINYKNVYFASYNPTDYDVFPLDGSTPTYLNLNSAFTKKYNSSYPSYESANANLGNIHVNDFADWFIVNNSNEEAYYSFKAGILKNNVGATKNQLKVSVYDFATNTNEVEQIFDISDELSSSEYTTCIYKITNPITAGLKKIRFDFLQDEGATAGSWLYNINNVTFYKRSLNEGYDFDPVAATDVDVVLTRSISANSWSTLCLPFTISAADLGTALGTTVTLAQYNSYDSGTNALTFTAESGDQTVTANTPCMIKVTDAVSGEKTISGVTLVSGDNYVTKSGMTFQGVYNSTKMKTGDFFVSGNKLYIATASTKNIKPFRGYFTTDAGAAKAPMLNIIEDGNTTAIYAVNADGTLVPIADGKVYNLSGQRVAQPTRGLYIVNGKKVIIK